MSYFTSIRLTTADILLLVWVSTVLGVSVIALTTKISENTEKPSTLNEKVVIHERKVLVQGGNCTNI